MKTLFLSLLFTAASFAASAQTKSTPEPDKNKEIKTVEASCGQCNFDLQGSGCDLAVRIDGKAYFVDGTDINKHGDAHASDGFCSAIRKAKVQGELVNNRFKVTYFKLEELEKKK